MNWIDVKSENDIKELLNAFGWFHDGCLREIHFWNSYSINDDLGMGCGDCTLNAKVLFQRQFRNPSAIEIFFSDIQRMNIVSTPPGYFYMIFETTFQYKNGIYYWADQEDWDMDNSNDNDTMWITAKGIKWRDRSEYMGDKLRYGQED